MREIKFRGRATERIGTDIETIEIGGWVYGHIYYDGGCDSYVIRTSLECGSSTSGIMWFDVKVDIKTVGQYVGLKDKNKKEVYEGDIVKQVLGCVSLPTELDVVISEVIFFGGAFRREIFASFDFSKDIKWNENVVVIGNIYENPELLKDSK